MVEPSRDAPESVRRIAQAGKLCLMFYGPAANKVSLFPYFLLTPVTSHVHFALCCSVWWLLIILQMYLRVCSRGAGLGAGSEDLRSAENDCLRPGTAQFGRGASDCPERADFVHYRWPGAVHAMFGQYPRLSGTMLQGKDPCFVLEFPAGSCEHASTLPRSQQAWQLTP